MCLSFLSCRKSPIIEPQPAPDFSTELAKQCLNNDSSCPVICVNDSTHEIAHCNAAMSKLLKIDVNDIVKKPFDQIFCWEELLSRRYRIEQVNGNPKIYVEIISSFKWNGQGQNLTVILFQDVTAKVSGEKLLLSSFKDKKRTHHRKKSKVEESTMLGDEKAIHLNEIDLLSSKRAHHHRNRKDRI